MLVLHGGAGNIKLSKKQKSIYEKFLSDVIYRQDMFDSIDTCASVLVEMEDSSLFNAGKGSFADEVGNISQDACIMTKDWIGSVTNIGVKNPILAALKVYEERKTYFISGINQNTYLKENKVS